jgi:hypothetical protein
MNTLPDPSYMDRQGDINWSMRSILVEWLIEVHGKFRLLPETIFLAVNLLDRSLQKRVIAVEKLQLVGITALFIASKYEEVICPSISNFLYMTDSGYTDDDLLKAERYMLRLVSFDLSYPNPMNFLRRISKADNYDVQSRSLAKYFTEMSCLEERLIATPPSLIAAASMWLSRKILDRGEWVGGRPFITKILSRVTHTKERKQDCNLVHYSGYSVKELLGTAQIMIDYVLKPFSESSDLDEDSVQHPTFHRKCLSLTSSCIHSRNSPSYNSICLPDASKKFYRASTCVRHWAEKCYIKPSGRQVRLEEWSVLG